MKNGINRALAAERKFFTLFLFLVTNVGVMFASDTQVDGIWYDFDNSTQTASVTFKGSDPFSCSDRYTGSVSIPSSVTYNAQEYSVTSIRQYAFYDCSGLISIEIPNSVTSIGSSAFLSCEGLTSVTIPNSVTSIGNSAFSWCAGLTSIVVEDGNTIYDSRNNCNAIIETSTNKLITGCKNTIISNSVTSIGDYVFRGCEGLTSVTIPNSITSIGTSAFDACEGLTSIEIPNSVTSIGGYAFSGCTGLTSVTIGNSVKSIGERAFNYCTGLTSMTNYATTPQTINSYNFDGVDKSTCTLFVPEESIDMYRAADEWKEFIHIEAISDAPTAIDNTPFLSGEGRGEASKILRNGQLFIEKNGNTYTLTGQEVR